MTKSFAITKREVYESYLEVKRNQGCEGVDQISLEDFETDLGSNLYKLWNRLSSGSYFPPAVRQVEIRKKEGGIRVLGIPTVSDRVAQTVIRRRLEPSLEAVFHPNSYGYRPRRSAHDAIAKCKERCHRLKWVLDLDIQSFFDSLDHELMIKALEWHAPPAFVLLYIRRWLKAPMEDSLGVQRAREKGTPQGGVISPLLANLYLHYAFDMWMSREFPTIPFERYADDIVCHTSSHAEAMELKIRLTQRLEECKLRMHPDKTKIVYCGHGGKSTETCKSSFDFLGYGFRPRVVRDKEGRWNRTLFLPGISLKAMARLKREIRNFAIPWWTSTTMEGIAKEINPVVRGWLIYYGKFYRSALNWVLHFLNQKLVQWITMKYRRYNKTKGKANAYMKGIATRNPLLFAHWEYCKS